MRVDSGGGISGRGGSEGGGEGLVFVWVGAGCEMGVGPGEMFRAFNVCERRIMMLLFPVVLSLLASVFCRYWL